jgi:hypothetical protein
MNVKAYYRHARSIGNYKAVDALALARQAATLDETRRVSIPPATVGLEVLPDGSNPIILSFGIKVF